MKNKTYRFAAALAVLLAFALVFVAPVSADGNVAKIGDKYYGTLQEALDEAVDGNTIEVVASTGDAVTLTTPKSLTIVGKEGVVLSGGLQLGDYQTDDQRTKTLTVEGLTFESYSLIICSYKDVVVKDNVFKNIEHNLTGGQPNFESAISINYLSTNSNVEISGNKIDGAHEEGISVGYARNVTITENVINGTYENSLKLSDFHANSVISITKNTLTNWGADGNEGRALRLAAPNTAKVIINDNFMNSESEFITEQWIKIDGGVTNVDVSKNYWGGNNPISAMDAGKEYYFLNQITTDSDKIKSYYSDAEMKNLVPAGEAEIDGVQYNTLKDAVTEANGGDTITLLKDVGITSTWGSPDTQDFTNFAILINKELTIDGAYFEISTTSDDIKSLFRVYNNVTFKNIVLNNSRLGNGGDGTSGSRIIDTRIDEITVNVIDSELIAPGYYSQPITIGGSSNDGLKINLEGTTINARHYPIIVFVPVELNIIDNSNISGYCALYFKGGSDGTNVVVSDSKLTGTNLYSGDSNSFGVIVFNNTRGVSVTLNNADLANAVSVEDAETEFIFGFTEDANTGNTVTVNSGVHLATSGSKAVFASDTFDNTLIVKNGVTSTFQIPAKYLEAGYECVGSGSSWKVQLAPAPELSYSPSAKDDNKDEPVEEPEEPVVEPETPVEVPGAGEPTVETEVTDGGEVELETPVEEPAVGEDGAVAADDEAKITAVVLPTGTDSEVTFIPISEQPAPAGKETSTKKVFEINVPTYEKGKPATIKFTMTVAELEADGKTAEQVALWHFDEETGEWTKLLTSYIIVDGVVYFEAITEDFSPFAIIYDENPVDEPVEEPETPASPAPVLGLIAALGAAVVLRRK